MNQAESHYLKLTEEKRAEREEWEALEKDPVAKAAKEAAKTAEEASIEAERKKGRRVVRNADNAEVMLQMGGQVILGYVDDVNGPEAAEVPDFRVTRHELRQVAKYWVDTVFDIRQKWEDMGQTSSSEGTIISFAQKRVPHIEAVLGQKLIDPLTEEYDAAKERKRKWREGREAIAAMRALAVKIEHGDKEVPYPEPYLVYHTFSDNSVLVTQEGAYGANNVWIEYWFSTTEERAEYAADRFSRDTEVIGQWRLNKDMRMRKLSKEQVAEQRKRWEARRAAEAEAPALPPATIPPSPPQD